MSQEAEAVLNAFTQLFLTKGNSLCNDPNFLLLRRMANNVFTMASGWPDSAAQEILADLILRSWQSENERSCTNNSLSMTVAKLIKANITSSDQ